MVLSRSRQIGMSLGHVPYPHLQKYIHNFHRLLDIEDDEDEMDFIRLFGALDDAFVKHHAEKSKPTKTKGK